MLARLLKGRTNGFSVCEKRTCLLLEKHSFEILLPIKRALRKNISRLNGAYLKSNTTLSHKSRINPDRCKS